MKNHDAQQTESELSDDVLAHVTGGAAGVAQPQGPIFPGVDFDYPKKPIDPRDIR